MTLVFLRKVSAMLLMLVMIMWSFVFSAEVSFAQPALSCPLHSEVLVRIAETDSAALVVGDIFATQVTVFNQNAYHMPGVKVALALFSPNDPTTPRYWYVGSGSSMLPSATEVEISLEAELSMVPAGDYVLKAFAFQGNETDMLGAILRDATNSTGIPLNKNTAVTTEVELSLFVDGEIVNNSRDISFGDIPEVRVEAKNLSSVPTQRVKMLSMISLGDVPLGGAVVGRFNDEVSLLPQFERINEFSIQPYSMETSGLVISTIVDGKNFTPVKKVSLNVADDEANSSWPYIAGIGVSENPLMENGEVAACVKYIGAWEELGYLPELLQGTVVLSTDNGTVFTQSIYSDDASAKNYFSFKPEMAIGNYDLKFNLLQNRINTLLTEDALRDIQAHIRANLVSIDERRLAVTCDGDFCISDEISPQLTAEREIVETQSFWFYAGIVIAALLLMYVMLRRLEPTTEGDSEKLKAEELQ